MFLLLFGFFLLFVLSVDRRRCCWCLLVQRSSSSHGEKILSSSLASSAFESSRVPNWTLHSIRTSRCGTPVNAMVLRLTSSERLISKNHTRDTMLRRQPRTTNDDDKAR